MLLWALKGQLRKDRLNIIILASVQYKVYNAQCRVYSIRYIVSSVHCKLQSVAFWAAGCWVLNSHKSAIAPGKSCGLQCSGLCAVQCVQYTVYNILCTCVQYIVKVCTVHVKYMVHMCTVHCEGVYSTRCTYVQYTVYIGTVPCTHAYSTVYCILFRYA